MKGNLMQQILVPLTVAYFALGGVLLTVWIQSIIQKDNTRSSLVNAQSARLQEKRMELCEKLCMALAGSDHIIYEVWDITDSSSRTDEEQKKIVAELLHDETAANILRELEPLCQLYFSEQLLQCFFRYEIAYNNLLKEPSHLNGTYGIDHSVDLHNDLRREIGLEHLTENIRQMLDQTAKIPQQPRQTDYGN